MDFATIVALVLAALVLGVVILVASGRRILEDYEAKLRPVDMHGADSRGKAEWEKYAEGEELLHVRFFRLPVPDGAEVEVRIAGRMAGMVRVRARHGRLKVPGFPKVAVGESCEIRWNNQVLLQGIFYPD